MPKKLSRELYKTLEGNLTHRSYLRTIKMSKKSMIELLSNYNYKNICLKICECAKCSCKEIYEMIKPSLLVFDVEPEEGWLMYTYNSTKNDLFSDGKIRAEEKEHGKYFLYEVLRTFLQFQKNRKKFNPILDFAILEEEAIEDFPAKEEYERLKDLSQSKYIYEFMRIGAEITPFNTVGHIAGVHYVAMHISRQLYDAKVPIDLSLISGAAMSHDIGKFGCKDYEEERIPYLHYYYTDECLKREGMPLIAHIASNHSTWDLELENLSVESLALIYADFRVKSHRGENNEEIIHFYTLKEAFNVILNKLDNVNEEKKNRYIKVYKKLKDFEDYMISIGVSTSLKSKKLRDKMWKDVALLTGNESVERIKFLAIEHNVELMNKFNSEVSFGNLLEDARSEKQWKNIRAYINTLKEYFTYMTQKQKQMTVNFLWELLTHREGDIRRQAAALIGRIIANYDEEYRKELPEGILKSGSIKGSIYMWRKYLKNITHPELKTTDQQRSWMGYTLKITFESLLDNARDEYRDAYLKMFFRHLDTKAFDNGAIFILLDTMLHVSIEKCTMEEKELMMDFVMDASKIESLEIKIAILRFVKYIVTSEISNNIVNQINELLKDESIKEEYVSIIFLKSKIREELGIKSGETRGLKSFHEMVEPTSDIFRENLKMGTPWVIKAVNIELLLDELKHGRRTELFYVATHFSNLLKVSERVSVRHIAGRGLIEVVRMLSFDQRNEIVIELTKGLEIGEYQFSKYIPECLGSLALMLHPEELDERLFDLSNLLESSNDKVASVTLDTLGEMLKNYEGYRGTFEESDKNYEKRKEKIIGMILRGMANYHTVVSQEAFMVLGQYIFGNNDLSIKIKFNIFKMLYKKMATLVSDLKEEPLTFFNNAAALNHIYRFISDYNFYKGKMKLEENRKVAFFPGTFDPFSLSHKGIVTAIRDLGYDVYLALDEFSWSKKTQPRLIRKKIISMSIANENNVYIFPDEMPINIANPKDINKLKNIFANKDIYIVVGSDVIANASSYKAMPAEDSIHTLNHIVFMRESMEQGTLDMDKYEEGKSFIDGHVLELKLPMYLEDISSTRIRENIDSNRDISSLIDRVVQNYIYDNSLYMREPQYKYILPAKSLVFSGLKYKKAKILDEMSCNVFRCMQAKQNIAKYMESSGVRTTTIRDGSRDNRIIALATVNQVDTFNLYEEFKDQELAAHIRSLAPGKIFVIKAMYADKEDGLGDTYQMILTETLFEALKEDFTYAIYYPQLDEEIDRRILGVLLRQGFREIIVDGNPTGRYGVDMRNPVTIFQNMDTVLKEPFNKIPKVQKALGRAHKRLQKSLTELYPGNLILSFNSAVMHHKLVDKITKENGVPAQVTEPRQLGSYMCVPFGKILNNMAVPNTVTKTLHTEKTFSPDLTTFKIKEYPFYSSIVNQVKTIKSFNRPVILVDDILHKGYRMRSLDPILKDNNVKVQKLMVGLLSGRGKDLMTVQEREVDSVYFVPNLQSWFVESSLYPFIGGDGVMRNTGTIDDAYTAINLIMPYVSPVFMQNIENESIYNFSKVCMENARDIFQVIEEEYQNIFQRKLTIQRLTEAVTSPKLPDVGNCLDYDRSISASAYIDSDIERLLRMKGIF